MSEGAAVTEEEPGPPMRSLSAAEALLPSYDVSDSVAIEVASDPDAAWRALLDIDLIELGSSHRMVGALGALRILPEVFGELAHGRRPKRPEGPLTLEDTAGIPAGEGGWVLLRRGGRELSLGLVGRFWRPVIRYADVSPDGFASFAEPGWAKTVYELRAEPLAPERTLLSGTMRTATTDEWARIWFRRYWTLGVGGGAHVLVYALLEAAREQAEQPVGEGIHEVRPPAPGD
jgi:hypothetical protein